MYSNPALIPERTIYAEFQGRRIGAVGQVFRVLLSPSCGQRCLCRRRLQVENPLVREFEDEVRVDTDGRKSIFGRIGAIHQVNWVLLFDGAAVLCLGVVVVHASAFRGFHLPTASNAFHSVRPVDKDSCADPLKTEIEKNDLSFFEDCSIGSEMKKEDDGGNSGKAPGVQIFARKPRGCLSSRAGGVQDKKGAGRRRLERRRWVERDYPFRLGPEAYRTPCDHVQMGEVTIGVVKKSCRFELESTWENMSCICWTGCFTFVCFTRV